MRICIVQDILPFHSEGGAQFLGWRTASGLYRRGHDVTVVTTCTGDHQGEDVVDGVRVVFLPAVTPWCYDFHRTFAKEAFDGYVRANQARFDVVQVRGWKTAGLAGLSYRKDRLSVPVTGHTSGLGWTYEFETRARLLWRDTHGTALARAKAVINRRRYYLRDTFPIERGVRHLDGFSTVTRRGLTLAHYLYGIPWRRLYLVNDGIPVERFSPPKKNENPGRLLYVGGLVRRKGVDLLLLAMHRLLPVMRELELRIVGDGVEQAALRGLARQLGVDESVVFAGQVDNAEVPNELRACGVFVNPSLSTVGYETVQIEAMLCGRIVVAPDTASNRMVIEPGHTGFFFRLGNPGSLAAAIMRVFALPDAEREMIETRARAWAAEQFSVEKMAEMNEEVFVQVLRKQQRVC